MAQKQDSRVMASSPKAAGGPTHGTHASTAAPADHGHGGFPPFDPSTFAPQLVWLAISFAALYFVMSRMALPRIASVLAERRERIQRDLAEAERLKSETDSALAAYEKSLADARGKAQGLAKDMRDRVATSMDAERRRVDDANTAKLAATEKQIADTKARALANVDQLAAETASAIVERLIGQQIGVDDVRRVVGQTRMPTTAG
ncbi:MAG: F0F1 ATP synthase subunit B [Hyphomicrobiaceae bacterium]|nr:F0F1 ATP synthase subunit B [Hyphomicrobiaceae bacterium]